MINIYGHNNIIEITTGQILHNKIQQDVNYVQNIIKNNIKVVMFVFSSVLDPTTLNLDPDPEFWPNLYPATVRIRMQGYVINLERKI